MKRSLDAMLHTLELVIGAILTVATASTIVLPVLLVAGMTIPAGKLKNDIEGSNIKKSIFAVSSKGKITQNALAKPTRLFSLLSKKDKNKEFQNETLNMFLELNKTNKKGEVIQYNTRSHVLTYRMLMKLQKNGFIENLNREPAGTSRLIAESLGMGNFKQLFSGKKTNMYNITFNLTDKERTKEELLSTLSNDNTEPTKEAIVEVVEKQETNVSDIERKRAELLAMKEELLKQKEILNQRMEQNYYTNEETYEEESSRHM